ncbi:MAG: MBL fold metallo-hydrolase [Chitinophagales bacterium]
MRKVFIAVVVLVVISFLVLFNVRPQPAALQSCLVEPKETDNSGLQVQFLGNTNLLFTDGETSILTDGFFTRPNAFKVLFGKVEPDKSIVEECLKKAGIEQLDAVIPLHSHFDHAMDAPMVADITDATLIGSSSTLNVGKGYGLPSEQMMIAPLNQVLEIGKFKITFFASRHWQYPNAKQRKQLLDQAIESPLIPPVKMIDYKEGISYTVIIEHDSTKIAIQGSAGFKENSIVGQDVDILFLAVAGIEVMDETYQQNYQEWVIDALQPEVIVPIHFDDFTVPLSKGLKTTSLLFNLKMGTNLQKAFELIEGQNKERAIKVLPLWKKISSRQLVNNK